MARVEHISIPLIEPSGSSSGTIHLSAVPSSQSLLWDYRNENAEVDASLNPIQVLESDEYVFRVDLEHGATITTDKPELFVADYKDGKTGRFRPGLHVGEMSVIVLADGQQVGQFSLEVISRKISYLSDYRAMLRNLTEQISELISDRFAASEQKFIPDIDRDAETLYQQFAFVHAFATSEEFQAAIRRVLAQPDRNWSGEQVQRPLSQGLKPSSGLLRSLVSASRRVKNESDTGLSSLPEFVPATNFVEDFDTPENRYIAQVLRRWIELAYTVRAKLQTGGRTSSQQRGLRETGDLISTLEPVIHGTFLASLPEPQFLPASSTVFEKKEGYRELHRAFLQWELAAALKWSGLEDVYGAGKKDVATLYEYWCFLILTEIVGDLCKVRAPNLHRLIEKTQDGLSIKLRQGEKIAISGIATGNKGPLQLALFYNRSFPPKSNNPEGSWSREMVPDFSLRIRDLGNRDRTTWLHFDAKYRVDSVVELFGPENVGTDKRAGRYKRDDLLRMHAYKDAVRRSSGAFILFPGVDGAYFREYQEIVPGIGAFPLVPTEAGHEGASGVTAFIADVLSSF